MTSFDRVGSATLPCRVSESPEGARLRPDPKPEMKLASFILAGALLWIGLVEAVRATEESKKTSSRQELIEDLKGLHRALEKYLEKHATWPQLPSGAGAWDEERFFAFWSEALEDFGATPEMWVHSRDTEGTKISYIPSQFSPGPSTPYRWKQPWVVPRASFGGESMVLLPDGAVISLRHLPQYPYQPPAGKSEKGQ